MAFIEELDKQFLGLDADAGSAQNWLARLKAEAEFAGRLAEHKADKTAEWQALILEALAEARKAWTSGATVQQAVEEAEVKLAPIGAVAKEYTIHCVGHAHIDMNWQWDWPETVATTNDTFLTVDKLMNETPSFTFSQDQTSIYQLMKDYLPELTETVKKRVAEGRWEVTSNQWVEGDKNLASGEIICRHLLYTKRFFKAEYGLDYDAVKLDYEPDTFGHAITVPTLLADAGVRWYYFCRGGRGPQLFWWQAKDGSRVLAFDDNKQWYMGVLDASVARFVLEFEAEYGPKDYLWAYGVGNHGGGPTRKDVASALEMDSWPLFPNVKFSTYKAFYTAAEQQLKDIPVVDQELNYVFEGCYTSESNIKYANRKGECYLVEAEACAALGSKLCGTPYPAAGLRLGWQHTMFNQFHDILPGSGVRSTYRYAQGLFQETMTQTSMAKTNALRAIAAKVDTAASCACGCPDCGDASDIGMSLGAGPGDVPQEGYVSRRGAGGKGCDPFVVFNPNPWQRTELANVRIFDRNWAEGQIVIKDDAGNTFPAQVVGKGGHWLHHFMDIAFPARDLPAMGYRSYSLARSVTPGTATGASGDGKGVLENEFLRVKIDQPSGSIVSLVDKATGYEFVPCGGKLGLLEYTLESPDGMSAWVVHQYLEQENLDTGWHLACPARGPHVANAVLTRKYKDSTLTVVISLAAGMRRVDFDLRVDWLERGSRQLGIPGLKVHFPVNVNADSATFECPNGFVERPNDGHEVPSQKWMDLTGTGEGIAEPVGVTVLNDCKYGHSANGNDLTTTLIRSSFDPDPLPELGDHHIRYAVIPHVSVWTAADATRAGYDFNLPLNVIGTDTHQGELPASQAFVEVLTPNVLLGTLKQAEDSEALVVRVYEVNGEACRAQVKLAAGLVPANAKASQASVLEVPSEINTARFDGEVVSVDLPAFGMATVILA